jgi:hypothetical protein
MLRKATIGAWSRKSASLGARPWLAGIAGEVGDQRAQTAARGRLRRLAGGGAGNLIGNLGLTDHPLDGAAIDTFHAQHDGPAISKGFRSNGARSSDLTVSG